MRHKINLVKPGTRESRSKFEVNVPTGIFFSPQHAWAKIEPNGTVLVGLDDLIRKIFDKVDSVELPAESQLVSRGETLFSLRYGDFTLPIPSPVSGKVRAVNSEHAEHPEWLAIKPFELSWMCGIEPSRLSEELQGMMIGQDSVDWNQKEISRFHDMAGTSAIEAAGDAGEDEQMTAADELELLGRFAKQFLEAE